MTPKEINENAKKYVLQSWSKQKNSNPMPIEKAEGIYFYDYDGNRYTDMTSQLVNLNLGFGNKEIEQAITKQASQYCYLSPALGCEARSTLGKLLIEHLPDSFGKIFFTNAGADANENAVKMARMYTGRNKIFSRYRSYHGSSFGAGNLTGEPRRYALEPGVPGFIKFFDPYVYQEKIRFASEEEATEFYLAKLREQIIYEGADSVAAIFLETITGSNGVIIPPKGYLPMNLESLWCAMKLWQVLDVPVNYLLLKTSMLCRIWLRLPKVSPAVMYHLAVSLSAKRLQSFSTTTYYPVA